ncbi:DUF3017 domain-containing protein [Myceligenerans pegani]|uniref:DUF3017 domain-containing protein n=1 Tax=Myceligenerans pegani TaxID=2776917 RepID=A0ABR9MV66_9MICO|nr:DUF3017 domain-containing protein [Myceligenerans sp. TRM 65318]MBE1874763.1 DUF3017 domain-containing protein [Myceligenerans sp. TRM 65318]MBE3017034.1 DUF3017 domain-containing protein [Myceligenerans sp. TRM 65318]
MDLSRTSAGSESHPGRTGGGTATLVAPDWRQPADEAGWNDGTPSPERAGHQPAEEDPLDAEHPSRRKNRAVWWLLGGVVLSLLLGLVVGGRAGSLGIAVTLAVAGTFRAVLRGPGPVGLAIRTRSLDVMMYMSAAVMIGVLAVVAPID